MGSFQNLKTHFFLQHKQVYLGITTTTFLLLYITPAHSLKFTYSISIYNPKIVLYTSLFLLWTFSPSVKVIYFFCIHLTLARSCLVHLWHHWLLSSTVAFLSFDTTDLLSSQTVPLPSTLLMCLSLCLKSSFITLLSLLQLYQYFKCSTYFNPLHCSTVQWVFWTTSNYIVSLVWHFKISSSKFCNFFLCISIPVSFHPNHVPNGHL